MDAAVLAEQAFFLRTQSYLQKKNPISEVTILNVAAQDQKSGS